jgi:solute carrier family 9 (sodium/hydrogen exchanger), member 8
MLVLLLALCGAEQVNVTNCQLACSSHGSCFELFETTDNETASYFVCDCQQGFSGAACEECGENRFGELCAPCPTRGQKVCSGHGTCDAGMAGAGRCLCEEGYAADSHCSEKQRFLENWPDVAGGTCVLVLAAILCVGLIVLIAHVPLLPRSAGAILLGLFIGFCYALVNPRATFSETMFFKPEVFFVFLIPPIMFEAGSSLNKTDFFNNIGTVLNFAVLGTLFTALIFGFGMFAICNVFAIYPFTIVECLLFGALICATDPVATISVNKLLHLNQDLTAVILGESILNDAISIALFKVFSSYATENSLSWTAVVVDFSYLFFGSISIGISFGIILALLLKLFRFSEILDCALCLVWVYIPYLVAEAIDMSGILSILFLGMVMGNLAFHSLDSNSRTTVEEYFKTFAFAAENFCFVYFGISMAISRENVHVLVIAAGIFCLLLARAAVVFALAPLSNAFRTHKLSGAEQVMIWISGARGAIAFSLALSLPIKNNGVIVSTTEYLILFTIVVLGMASYPVAKRFSLDEASEESEYPMFDKYQETFEKQIKPCFVRG